jgi:hypothetical protein
VGDELVAGAAKLVGVSVAGEFESVLDRLAVDRRDRDGRVPVFARRGVELLDDREEVCEELAAGYVCLRPSRNRRPS